MKKEKTIQPAAATEKEPRPKRADAQRKMAALLKAAMEVFATSGVDAPVREIAERAGVGLGTVYRHFPQRSDLIAAVFRNNVDTCADAAPALASQYPPTEALSQWLQRYMEFIGTKRGLAKALYCDPAYSTLPEYFNKRLRPALIGLLDTAVAAKAVRPGIDADDLLIAVANLCSAGYGRDPEHPRRMVELLIDGLRFRAEKDA
ncbi:TetR family transcriptional regulator [Granulicella sp. 5B5]|uniref:TetR/AcrR family transcriptional regulator n=1 Tax=Granulicella sp. 5B5 TaxID=1617967 RepID=UPI0015F622B7|nr:TetR/AcrR family transcriptional regulator [Granulicella sp. 5B5]QMV18315.1 TetR family transcriptional regulator [Granulicella sp. 5B5]